MTEPTSPSGYPAEDGRMATDVDFRADADWGKCSDCDRCQHDPESDCLKAAHPHCKHCGHCALRHQPQPAAEPSQPAPGGGVETAACGCRVDSETGAIQDTPYLFALEISPGLHSDWHRYTHTPKEQPHCDRIGCGGRWDAIVQATHQTWHRRDAEVAALTAERDRLRARTHEIQEAADKRIAPLMKYHATWERIRAYAAEVLKEPRVVTQSAVVQAAFTAQQIEIETLQAQVAAAREHVESAAGEADILGGLMTKRSLTGVAGMAFAGVTYRLKAALAALSPTEAPDAR